MSIEAKELFADHFAVCFAYKLLKPPTASTTIRYRKLKQLDLNRFKEDIACLKDTDTHDQSLDTLIGAYNNVLHTVLDKHTPIITKRVKGTTAKPWYDNEVHHEKNERRKIERIWRKCSSSENLNRYKTQKNCVIKLIENKKISFCNNSVSEKSGDQKALYTLVRKLTNKQSDVTYPKAHSNEELAEKFSTFFKDKIKKNQRFARI